MRRALLICRHDYWPALTPDRLWELPYDLWAQLALSCDAIAKQKEEDAAELERLRKRR
ncbi:hypothetical protein QE418_000609 [Microbacterium testaceum]|nr:MULTISPECIES: hypothetical protein [Microbacterium]MDQ1111161.1 hypothetical protein [Microbacterium testaceum]MDR6691464.1 hypothetical protein [Microbacterium sp. 1154]REC98327.1 hypothetical protein DEU35_1427 [Microbacterium sp. AG157]